MARKRLQVNVSGGRTSAYMAWWLKKHKSKEYDFLFIFANTGQEDRDTYRFLRCVDEAFGLNLVIVECVVHEGRKASTHVLKTHDTLSVNGEPYERQISKYGISNVAFKHCNRELKFNPMASYTNEHWPDGDFQIAIGIRPDEKRRVSPTAVKQGIVYPLVEWHEQGPNTPDKQFIMDWFERYGWDLNIPEFLGNCKWCYKKAFGKLRAAYRHDPTIFDFPMRMEDQYGHIKPSTDPTPGNRKWWRGYLDTRTMLKMFNETGERNASSDEDGGCSDSCEPYEMIQLAGMDATPPKND